MRPALKYFLLAMLLAAGVASAQQRTGVVTVSVVPDQADWTYEPGEPVSFRINVVRDGHPVIGSQVSYQIGPEMMPPTTRKSEALGANGITVAAGTMNEPGFLRCIAVVEVDGKSYRGLATAGFKPDAIKPTTDDPPDFDAFWKAGKEDLAKLPVDAQLTLLPD